MENDISNDHSLDKQGGEMKLVIRIISSAMGGIILFLGAVLLLANLFGINPRSINAVGVISVLIGMYLIYVIALKSR